MILKSNVEVIINKVELATRLAHMYVVDELKFDDEIYDELYLMSVYTDKAQMIFNIAFDIYISIIEEGQR
jgi:hypothetical protein